nr:DUF397 domain-containing protein [Actinomadura mexicana]
MPNVLTTRWRESSYSGGTGGECVELAVVSGHVLLRDSKDPDGPRLELIGYWSRIWSSCRVQGGLHEAAARLVL